MMYDENGDNIIYKNDTGVKVISKKDYFAKLNKIIKQSIAIAIEKWLLEMKMADL